MKSNIRKKKLLSVFVVLFLVPSALSAREKKEKYTTITFNKQKYQVGIVQFEGIHISSESEYLIQGFPLLLMKELEDCPDHVFSKQEIERMQLVLVNNRLKDLYNKMSPLVEKRDALLFDGEYSKKDYKEKTKSIKEIQEEINWFLNYDPEKISMPEVLDIEFKKKSDDQPLLIMDSDLFIKKETIDSNLDMAVYGNIEQIGDYYYITVSLFNFITGESYTVYKGAGGSGDIPDMVKESSENLRYYILGREWGLLEVRSGFDDAFIYLDTELVGIGNAVMPVLSPGDYTVTIRKEGYYPMTEKVTVAAGSRELLEYQIEKVEGDYITITTIPAEADVYIGSIWAGTTPLTVERPRKEFLLRVTYPGYNTYKGGIGPRSDSQIFIDMIEGVSDFEALYDQQKKKFYWSLGFFSMSLSLPLVFWGMKNNYSDRGEYTTSDVMFGLFWGGLGISAGFLTNMFIRLFKYLKTAEDAAY